MSDKGEIQNVEWMKLALKEARQAAREGEVPVGAVVVLDQRVISQDHNRSLQLSDPTAHAEILALRKAGRVLGNYRLSGCRLYVTVEPCPMCAGAAIWARLEQLIYGAPDEKAGAVASRAELLQPGRFNHNVQVIGGVLEPECRQIIQNFFRARR